MSLDRTSQMFCQLSILKIYDLIDINTCIPMYKVVHIFLTLQNMFSMSSCQYIKNIYNIIYIYKNFFFMFARARRKKFSITIKGMPLWNSSHNFFLSSS